MSDTKKASIVEEIPSAPGSDAGTPDSGSTAADGEDEDSATVHSRSTTAASASTAATVVAPAVSKSKAKAPEDKKEETKGAEKGPKAKGNNLIGKINNLVTSDLNNITSGRDFLFICASPSIHSICKDTYNSI